MTLATLMQERPKAATRNTMTTTTIGAATRPTLALHYESQQQPGARQRRRRSPILSTRELRRLVAAMVD